MNIKTKLLALLFIVSIVGYHCQLDLYLQGQRIFESQCANCHMDDGSGLVEVIQDIANSELFDSKNPEPLLNLLLKGGPDDRPDGLQMPAYATILNRVELCNVINFLNNKWDEDFEEIEIQEFDKIYKKLMESR